MTQRTNRTLTHKQFAQVIEVVKINKELFSELNNAKFSQTIETMLAFQISPSTIKEVREYCDLPPAPRSRPASGVPKTNARNGMRRLASEYVRLFRLLGVDEHELTQLTDFAGGKGGYPSQKNQSNGSGENDDD